MSAFRSSRYNRLEDDTHHSLKPQLEDDTVGLLPQDRPAAAFKRKPRPSITKKVLLGLAALIALVLVFGAGLVTQWKARVLPSSPGFSLSDLKNETLINGTALALVEPIVMPDILPATNASSSDGEVQSSFSLVAPPPEDLLSAASDPDTQPDLPFNENCTFEHEPQLGGEGNVAKGNLFRLTGRVEREDIRQGGIGDCGFVAAVLSLIGNDQQQQLQQALTFITPELIIARFREPSTFPIFSGGQSIKTSIAHEIRIDDEVAVLKKRADGAGCHLYVGAYPGKDVQAVMFMPLLEKAWVKFLDVNPKFKGASDHGYLGITGTQANIALQALTGKEGHVILRSQPDLDIPILVQIFRCINEGIACVAGILDAKDLSSLGTKGSDEIIRSSAGNIATSDNVTYSIIEKSGNVATLVGHHYYAIDRELTPIIDGTTVTIANAIVTLHNPWGQNPEIGRPSGGDGTVRIGLFALASMIGGIEWAENVSL
jgi:hypothetical protein